MTGRELYSRWRGPVTTYTVEFLSLSQADRDRWERLALEVHEEQRAAIADVVARREGQR